MKENIYNVLVISGPTHDCPMKKIIFKWLMWKLFTTECFTSQTQWPQAESITNFTIYNVAFAHEVYVYNFVGQEKPHKYQLPLNVCKAKPLM